MSAITPVGALVRGMAKYTIGGVAAQAFRVISVPIYLYFLSADEYGIQALALINEQLLLVLAGYAMTNALGRFYVARLRSGLGEDEVVGTALWSILALAIPIEVVWQLHAPTIAATTLSTSVESIAVIRLVGVSFFFSLFFGLALTLWQLREEILLYTACTVLRFGGAVCASVALLAWTELGVIAVVAGWALASVAAGASSMLWLLRHFRPVVDLATARALAAYGSPLVPAALLGLLLNGSDRFLLKYFAGLDQVGVYATAFAIAYGMSLLLVTPFKQAWAPIMWKLRGTPDELAMHRTVLRYYVIVQVMAVVGATFLCYPVMTLLTGSRPEFVAASLTIPLVYVGFAFSGAYDVLSAGYFFADRTIFYTVTVALSATLNVVMNILLVPLFGIWGTAASYAIAFGAFTALSWVFGRRFLRVHHDWRRLWLAIASSVPLLVAPLALRDAPVALVLTVGALSLPMLLTLFVQIGVLNSGEVASARKSLASLVLRGSK